MCVCVCLREVRERERERERQMPAGVGENIPQNNRQPWSIVTVCQKKCLENQNTSNLLSFCLMLKKYNGTTVLIKMSYARWEADCVMEMSQLRCKHSSVSGVERTRAVTCGQCARYTESSYCGHLSQFMVRLFGACCMKMDKPS